MLTMAEKFFLGLTITLSIVLAGLVVIPAVSYKVELVTSPNSENFYVPAGKPFNITCRFSGFIYVEEIQSLKWLNHEGQVIPKGNPGTQEIEKNSLTLTFTDPKKDESGVYTCMAVLDAKQTLKKSVSIVFYGSKPSFESDFQNITAAENSFLEIPCAAEGELPIKYEWYNEIEERITADKNSSIYVSDSAKASVLTIPQVTLNHAGMYTCLANNVHGTSSKLYPLTVIPGNDTTNGTESFRGATAVNVTATSVKFAFDVTGLTESIEARYYEVRNGTESFTEFKYGDNYEIKGLIPAGRYYFKFRAYPSANDMWSKYYRVDLLPDTPEVIFRSIDSGTVKFEWLFKYEDKMRKTIDWHEITYFTVQTYGVNIDWRPSDCRITIRIPECGPTSYTISGLNTRGYYEIQLRAHTTSGYGKPYTQKIFIS